MALGTAKLHTKNLDNTNRTWFCATWNSPIFHDSTLWTEYECFKSRSGIDAEGTYQPNWLASVQ